MSRLSTMMQKARWIDASDILPYLFEILKKSDIREKDKVKQNEMLGKEGITTIHTFGWILSLPMRN